MRSQLRVGTVAGVPIEANWSIVAITALIAYLLATSILPATTHASTRAYWVMAIVVAVLFVGAIAAHEVAHAVVARRMGIQVKRITLWMLGGVTEFETAPATARQQLAVSAAGPATSLALGGVFMLGGYLASLADAPDLVVAGFVWLGGTNLFLGVFNLLPGAPLDGGGVLQGLLWQRWADRARAEAAAARCGRGVGLVFVGIGAATTVATTAWFDGLWLMLVGWYVYSASTNEERSAGFNEVITSLTVRDVMSPDPVTLPPNRTVDEVADEIVATRQNLFPVVDLHGRILGTVDIDTLVRLPEAARHNRLIGDVVRRDEMVATATPEEPVRDVVRRINGTHPILVVDGSRLVGIVTEEDIRWAARRAALQRGPVRVH